MKIRIFIYVLLFTVIFQQEMRGDIGEKKDTLVLVHDLLGALDLSLPSSFINIQVLNYKQVNINGSEENFYFIEFDYEEGPMSEYPWKMQLLVTEDYQPVHAFHAQRYEWVEIFPDTYPLLLILNATGKGNGYHQLYKMKDKIAVNIYEGGREENLLKTYDAHQDNDLFEPYELQLMIEDRNKDGFNDLVFKGCYLYSSSLSYDEIERSEIEYVFLYDPVLDLFKEYKEITK